jgi:rhodanese-related sulfurtransferase
MIVAGGTPGWAAAGFTLFQGVNVPSKTLGELAEHAWQPETIDAPTLKRWQDEGRAFRFFDCRPPAEYAKMRVPGAACLPNGELAHRFAAAVPQDDAPVVVTCAGRTRSIVGALGLRLAGVAPPVYALENGTQGWQLAGFTLERGNTAAPYPKLQAEAAAATRARAEVVMSGHAIQTIDRQGIDVWRDDRTRTTYLFDLRAPEESAADPAPAFRPALSGQLVQATDQWVGVRHARLVLLDDLGLRGAIAAFWLRQLGYDVAVARLDDGLRALQPQEKDVSLPPVPSITAAEALRGGGVLIDLRGSAAFRKEHTAAARWGIRPRLGRLGLDPEETVYLIGDTETATLAAKELASLGLKSVFVVKGGHAALAAAGAPIEADDSLPSAQDAIDFLFFVHDRHDGNLEASRRYLAWEQGLIAQLDAAERSAFRLSDLGV